MSNFFQSDFFVDFAYICASILFIFGLRMLGNPERAQRGNLISSLGMLLAIVVTLLDQSIISYQFLSIALIAGAIVGASAATTVKMTTMPELVALFNGFGGIASLLVGSAEFLNFNALNFIALSAVSLTILIGGVTFSGSLLAFGKLSEILDGKPFLFFGQRIVLITFLLLGLALSAEIIIDTGILGISKLAILASLILVALILGILLTAPIGGADMPVIIALLNSYSGLAAASAGFVINNNVLIVAGSLVGASGVILTQIMCKAMNRSLTNVLFGGFGAPSKSSAGGSTEIQGEVKPINVADSYLILEAANSVLFVPGYGMAVSQAQHSVRELGELLEGNGCDVKYGIHPVAGRMPGHMNVLLAEANVSYDLLVEPDDVNPIMETVDVCVVIGANDVVNPDARENEGSPIYGMPVIEVDRAKTVFVLKRSMASGFAGIDNPLFLKENTRMLFGDAKESISTLVSEFKS
ncbi:NAD(P)(+) transhydrogenase (Re/Si-specific) subunit beta [SAR86 cluster bacterium]|jgi:NAD(P) transhydrogenase subunit beta|nr:NAD(P)(+) transhydrogenase (Re/Si-specific) subunit beta [SAR86 cluster bacterium]